MNRIHRWYCRSAGWGELLHGKVIPWALEGVQLGERLLEVGPGPGLSTDLLRTLASRVTAIEYDSALARSLADRMKGTNVEVREGDASAMPFEDRSFTAAACFTMLHHVASPELQDRLFAEVLRVLRPGGAFVGTDSRVNLRFRLFHIGDTMIPVDPFTLESRLRRVGFGDVRVTATPRIFRFQARRPQD